MLRILKHIFKLLNLIRKFDETNFTLEKLVKVKIQNFSEQIIEISNKSTLELDLENVKYFRSKLYKKY